MIALTSPTEGRSFEFVGANDLRFLNAKAKSIGWLLAAVLLAGGWSFALGESTSKSGTSSAKKSSTSTKKTAKKSNSKHSRRHTRVRGQKKIDDGRTRQIQQALAKAHYLEGEPSGVWDSETEAALRRFQAANGWQTKVVPDSRALIKLGLGPSHDKLMNPETAMTGGPAKAAGTEGGAKQ
jgi:peptidoglycan hydrolase-like protein with peptidoglycan-binding domain